MENISLSVMFAAIYGSLSGALTGEMGAALIGAIVGACSTAVITIAFEVRKDRKNRALELIQEYTCPDFIQIRNEAGRAFRKVLHLSPLPSWDALHDNLDASEWQKISKILHFYKKLDLLVQLKEVNFRYISAHFSNEFWHWNNKYFQLIDNQSSYKEAEFTNLFSRIEKP